MFLARANQLAPFAAARDSDGSVAFWTPFACCVAMPLRGGFDGEDVSLAWHSAGPVKKGYSPLPLVWGERRAAERNRWQALAMAEWRQNRRAVKTADGDVSCSEETLAAMHEDAAAAEAPPEFGEDPHAAADAGIPPAPDPVAAERKPAPRKAKKAVAKKAKKKAAKKGGRKK